MRPNPFVPDGPHKSMSATLLTPCKAPTKAKLTRDAVYYKFRLNTSRMPRYSGAVAGESLTALETLAPRIVAKRDKLRDAE